MKLPVIAVLFAALVVHQASAHIRLISPAPRNDNSGIKNPYPCKEARCRWKV